MCINDRSVGHSGSRSVCDQELESKFESPDIAQLDGRSKWSKQVLPLPISEKDVQIQSRAAVAGETPSRAGSPRPASPTVRENRRKHHIATNSSLVDADRSAA